MGGTASRALVVLLVVAACGGTTAVPSTPVVVTTGAPAVTATTSPLPVTTTMSPLRTTTTITPDTTVSGPAAYEFTVAGDTVAGPERIDVALGESIVIVVTADVADEVHLHGYDLTAEVTPDTPARLEVLASIPGIFEIELEDANVPLTELEVR